MEHHLEKVRTRCNVAAAFEYASRPFFTPTTPPSGSETFIHLALDGLVFPEAFSWIPNPGVFQGSELSHFLLFDEVRQTFPIS